tara:strand:- start:417 stop:875 length:459 start_codon:yes stop_codon:yes gene_type:complete
MRYKNFSKLDFKKFHPGGSLSIKLKTVSDLMVIGRKLPLVNENVSMKKAIKIISKKKLGVLIVKNKNGHTTGIVTDGDLKRIAQRYSSFEGINVKKVMKQNPISINGDTLAASALSLMNSKKITSLCVHKGKNKNKTIGLIHMHDILKSNIT